MVFLHGNKHIAAPPHVLMLALLVYNLIERQVRRALERVGSRGTVHLPHPSVGEHHLEAAVAEWPGPREDMRSSLPARPAHAAH